MGLNEPLFLNSFCVRWAYKCFSICLKRAIFPLYFVHFNWLKSILVMPEEHFEITSSAWFNLEMIPLP